jgi:SAM-dependent methyltransferase
MKNNTLLRWKEAQKSECRFWYGQVLSKRKYMLKQRYGKIFKILEKNFHITNKTKILDVGCGPYPLSLFFQRGRKYGLDPLVEEYKKIFVLPKNVHFKRGVAEKIPWPRDAFDIVICRDALDHTANPEKTLKEINRVLKQDGYLILGVNVFSPFLTFLKKLVEKLKLPLREKMHPHFFTKNDLMVLCKNNSFKLIANFYIWRRPYILKSWGSKNLKRTLVYAYTSFWNSLAWFDRMLVGKNQYGEYLIIAQKI